MNKDLSLSMLLDFYGALLTEKQFDSLDLYYNQDLSLAEIALEIDITRQGVHDNIKRGEKLLREYEEKLHLCEKFSQITGVCSVIKERLNVLKNDNSQLKRAEISEDIVYHLSKIEDLI